MPSLNIFVPIDFHSTIIRMQNFLVAVTDRGWIELSQSIHFVLFSVFPLRFASIKNTAFVNVILIHHSMFCNNDNNNNRSYVLIS